MSRMAKITESLALGGNTLPVVFVRYNPDTFKVDGATKRVLKVEREKQLVQFLRGMQTPLKPLSIQYMFYNCTDGVLDVVRDPDYNAEMKKCCFPPITQAGSCTWYPHPHCSARR